MSWLEGNRRSLGGAIGIAIVAILLPASRLATGAADSPERLAQLTTGFNHLRLALLLLAVAVVCTPVFVKVPRVAPAAADTPRTPDRDAWPLVAVLVIALVLRSVRLDAGLWLDEILTLSDYVRQPLGYLLTTYDSQNNHPLFSLAAHLSWLAVGKMDWAIRIPAVLVGVASIWATFRLVRSTGSRTEAWLVTGLLVVSYHHVWFSQNARGYTALLFCSVIGTHLLHDLLSGRAVRPLRTMWAYAIVMGLGTYVHLTAALVVVGHAVVLLLPLRTEAGAVPWTMRRAGLVATVLAAVVSIVLYAVILTQLIEQVLQPTMGDVRVEWKSAGWLFRETMRGLSQGLPGGLALPIIGVTVMAAGVWSWFRRNPMFTGLMLAPIAFTLAGAIALGHNLWPRFFFFAASFLVMVAVRGGMTLCELLFRRRGQQVALVGGVAVVMASLLLLPRAWQPKQDYAAVVRTVAEARQPGDAVATIDIAAVIDSLTTGIPGASRVHGLDALRALEASHPRTIAIYTFPVRVRAVAPDLLARLESAAYRPIARIPATVGGGEFHIVAHISQ